MQFKLSTTVFISGRQRRLALLDMLEVVAVILADMNHTLQNTLRFLGCNEKEIKLYMACLELGSVPLNAAAKYAKLQRSTAYVVADELLSKGFILEDHKAYKKSLIAVEPDILLRKLEAKQRQIGRQTLLLKEQLPELRALHQAPSIRPTVRTYQGQSGLIAMMRDILACPQEILLWTNQSIEQKIFDSEAHRLFIQERINKQIPIRVLATNDEASQHLVQSDEADLRRTKILSEQITFTSETYIYGNKVAIIDVSQDIFGIITENEHIAASQRAIFEMTWANQ